MDLTNKEKKIIADTWSNLMYRAQVTSNEYRLEEQLKIGRRLQDSLHTARVLILREVARLYRNPNETARNLIGISGEILLGSLIGLDSVLRSEKYSRWMPCSVEELLTQIDEVSKIQDESIRRLIEAIDCAA